VSAARLPSRGGEPNARWSLLVTLSFVIHATGFGIAVGLPRLLPRPSGPRPVYVVDLVSLPVQVSGAPPPGGTVTPPAPKPAPAKPEKTIKIPDRQAQKTPPKKPVAREEKPAPKKTPEKPAPAPTATPAAAATPAPTPETAAATGSGQGAAQAAGGSGPPADRPGVEGGTGSGGADAYTFYYALLDRKIRGAWKKPLDPENLAARQRLACLVTLSLSSSGRVLSLELAQASGFEPLDRSALRAVQDAGPFPPFPYQLGVSSLTINFEFVLTP
jgi:TonB family protein